MMRFSNFLQPCSLIKCKNNNKIKLKNAYSISTDYYYFFKHKPNIMYKCVQ